MDNEENVNSIVTENKETTTTQVNTNNTDNSNNTPTGGKKGFSIASLVLGILSVCCFCIWYIAIPCAILAIIFGVLGRKQNSGKGMATAGLVLGIVSIALTLLYILFLGAIITAAFGAATMSGLY